MFYLFRGYIMKKICAALLLYSLVFSTGCLGSAAKPTWQGQRFPRTEEEHVERTPITTPTNQVPGFIPPQELRKLELAGTMRWMSLNIRGKEVYGRFLAPCTSESTDQLKF